LVDVEQSSCDDRALWYDILECKSFAGVVAETNIDPSHSGHSYKDAQDFLAFDYCI